MIYVVLIRSDRNSMMVVAVRDRFGAALHLARGLMRLAEGSENYLEQVYGRSGAAFFFSNTAAAATFPIVKIESRKMNVATEDWVYDLAKNLGDLK